MMPDVGPVDVDMAGKEIEGLKPLDDPSHALSGPYDAATWSTAWMRLTAVRIYLALSADPQVGRHQRRSLLRALARHLGTSEAHLRKMAAEYFYVQSIEMFLPKRPPPKAKGKRRPALDARVEAIIVEELARHRRDAPHPSADKAVIEHIRRRCREAGLQPPALLTIMTRVKNAP